MRDLLAVLPIENHSSMALFNTIIQFLEEHKFLLENSDGQSYDDASNMKGSEQGQPGFLKSINKYAYYVPCANHSLNFVGEKLFFTVPEVID